jgi:phosphatidylglycerol:prolipoprotein diacylglycerol transferase
MRTFDEKLRHPTQLYATFWETAVMIFIVQLEKRKPGLPPGWIFTIWIALHALGRLVMEHFRDDPRGSFALGLSPGEGMSLIVLIWSGVNAVLLTRQRDS